MAVTDYASLKTAIQSWMFERTDLATNVDEFIDLAEADFNRLLRLRDMETTTDLTLTDSTATVPADFLEWRSVTALTNPRRALDLVSPEYLDEEYGYRAAGDPSFFSLVGTTIEVVPHTTADVRMIYYAKIPALSDSETTNWLLTKAPGLYLFQSLAYASAFIGDDTQAQKYFGLASGEVEKVQADDRGARWARAARRSAGVRP